MATTAHDIEHKTPKAVYVFEAPVRIWHWVHALSIVVLAVTGYLIANPLPSVGGEASDSFLMGNLRLIHFIAGYVFTIGFVVRIYWGFVGNRWSRELLYLPVWRGQWWRDLFEEIKYYLFLRREPTNHVAHNALAQAAIKPGVLDSKTKELIALAIGITARCDGCLAFHAQAAKKHGATREEVIETIAVALYMGGGPSMIYGAEALSCFDALD